MKGERKCRLQRPPLAVTKGFIKQHQRPPIAVEKVLKNLKTHWRPPLLVLAIAIGGRKSKKKKKKKTICDRLFQLPRRRLRPLKVLAHRFLTAAKSLQKGCDGNMAVTNTLLRRIYCVAQLAVGEPSLKTINDCRLTFSDGCWQPLIPLFLVVQPIEQPQL